MPTNTALAILSVWHQFNPRPVFYATPRLPPQSSLIHTMPGISSLMRDILDDSRGMWLFSNIHRYTPTGLESSATSHLPLPEVWAPAQYLIDVVLRPALARRLSSTYMDVVARYRETCQSHFDRVTHGGHLIEYYREVFIILFKRTVQAWDSQIVSIVRVHLCQAVQATIRPERVDVSTIIMSKALVILNTISHRYAWMAQRKPKSLRDSGLKQRILLVIK